MKKKKYKRKQQNITTKIRTTKNRKKTKGGQNARNNECVMDLYIKTKTNHTNNTTST